MVILPAAHTLQLTAPLESENLPTLQATHAPVAPPANPGLHMQGPVTGPVEVAVQVQSVTAVLAIGDSVRSGHVSHAALPFCSLYVPVAHAVHGKVS